MGVVTTRGVGGGTVAGSAVYVLTNSPALAAPFAGSLVSALMGVGALLRDHHAGTIDGDQFVELSHIVALDAAVVGLAAAAGQTLVPIPVLGALLGSLGGKLVASALKDGLGESASELTARLPSTSGTPTSSSTRSTAPSCSDWTLGSATWSA